MRDDVRHRRSVRKSGGLLSGLVMFGVCILSLVLAASALGQPKGPKVRVTTDKGRPTAAASDRGNKKEAVLKVRANGKSKNSADVPDVSLDNDGGVVADTVVVQDDGDVSGGTGNESDTEPTPKPDSGTDTGSGSTDSGSTDSDPVDDRDTTTDDITVDDTTTHDTTTDDTTTTTAKPTTTTTAKPTTTTAKPTTTTTAKPTTTTTKPATTTQPPTTKPPVVGGGDVLDRSCGSGSLPAPMNLPSGGSEIWSAGFEDINGGGMDRNELRSSSWKSGWETGVDEGRASIVGGRDGNAVRINYPAGGYRSGGSGAQWQYDFSGQEAMHLTYWVRFGDGFQFVRGGKMPGLSGGSEETGGGKPDGYDGWSGRLMWRDNGCGSFYVYHPDQPDHYGHYFNWAASFEPGTWHRIDQVVVMNNPNSSDGVMLGWLDGRLVVEKRDMRYRKTSGFAIDKVYFSTFFGGSDSSWAPSSNQMVDFDGFTLRTTSRQAVQR